LKLFGNSLRGLISTQKHLLYRTCILLIALYNFLLWYYNKALLAYLLRKLEKIQYKVAIWILGAFCTFPLLGVKAIAGLIPIYLHLQKLDGRFQLRTYLLPLNHFIKSLMELRHSGSNNY